MKYSLLDMTQTILSSLDSDEVNSIEDTAESRQVAQVIRTAYFNIMARTNLPEHKQLFNLVSSSDATQPVLMTRPTNTRKLEWIKYRMVDTSEGTDSFEYVTILPLQQFLDMIHQLDPDETTVDSMTLNSFTFYYQNDRNPTYCTVVDDYYVVFDSYDIVEELTLQSSKTLCYGLIIPSFTMSDSYVPDMDDQQFPLLLNEAKSLAFLELKQVTNEKAEQESKRQWRTLQRTKNFDKQNYLAELPDFGRRRGAI